MKAGSHVDTLSFFDRPTVEAFAGLYQRLARALARDADRSVGRLLASAR